MLRSLIIGLGSMGKRRIRCLNKIDSYEIIGIDPRIDRREETKSLYNIPVYESIEEMSSKTKPDFVIISSPPDQHLEALHWCVNQRIDCFVEASVIIEGLELLANDACAVKLIRPSSTLLFHPAIQILKEVISQETLGSLSNILVHSGQYLPYWHSYESVSDFYVSQRSTGGARELVPFELTWIIDLFGAPLQVGANYRKTINIPGAETIDDTYNILLDYGNFLGSMTIDVVSRHPNRRILVNGSRAQFLWEWENNYVEITESDSKKAERTYFDKGVSTINYNQNINEEMYINELKAFIDSRCGASSFPNTLQKDLRALELLQKIELANDSGRFIQVK